MCATRPLAGSPLWGAPNPGGQKGSLGPALDVAFDCDVRLRLCQPPVDELSYRVSAHPAPGFADAALRRHVYTFTRLQAQVMSTTIRVSEKDKEALETLRRRIGARTMAETLRYAIATAEAEDERFVGNVDALGELLSAAGRSSAGKVRVTEHVDEELARALAKESPER